MARTQKELNVTVVYVERTAQQKKDDYARFVKTLTPLQRRALYDYLLKTNKPLSLLSLLMGKQEV